MLDADADAEPYARADAETDATSYYTVTGAGTDDVGIETTNAPARSKVGRAGPRAPRAVRV